MPMLLEDLMEETSVSYRRLTERLGAESREWNENATGETDLEMRRNRCVESAELATHYALSKLPEVEGIWRAALAKLRPAPLAESSLDILRVVLQMFKSGDQLIQLARSLWNEAEKVGATAKRLDEIAQADAWLKKRITETKKAIEHRTKPWQPSDPERFARELKLAREGKTVSADEARTWFRSKSS